MLKNISKNSKQYFIVGLVLVTLSLSSFAEETQQSEPLSPVEVESVKSFEVSPTADIMGTVYSRNQVELTAGVSGRLEWVAEPGTYLKQGDLVAQIELLPLQLRQAEQLAQLRRAKINLQYLERELKRQEELKLKKSVSQYQLDQTQSQYELAGSDLEIAELKLQQINQEMDRATILSPFDGVVTERRRRAGFDVGRSEILVQILDTESLEVRLHVPVKYLAFVKPGSAVVLSTHNGINKSFSLKADATTIIPAANPRSQTFEIRVDVPDEGLRAVSKSYLTYCLEAC